MPSERENRKEQPSERESKMKRPSESESGKKQLSVICSSILKLKSDVLSI